MLLKDFLQKVSSGSVILLRITLDVIMILQNISGRVVGYVLVHISPSNIFVTMLLPARFHQKCQAAFGRCKH